MISACASLGAGSSCHINVPVPEGINARTRTGSALLTVAYETENGKTQKTNGLINFQYIDAPEAGVHVNTAPLSNLGKTYGRAVVYAYAGGSAKDIYDVSSMQSNNPGFVIASGDLTGLQLASGGVQAIEIEGVAPNYLEKTRLDIVSQSKGKTYLEDVAVSVLPKLNLATDNKFPSVDAGFAPIRDLAEDGDTVKLYFINDGNVDLHLNQPLADSGITLKPNDCSETLAAGSACEVEATLAPTSTLQHGTVSVTDSVLKGVSAVSSLAWFSDAGQTEAVALSINPDSLVLDKGQTKVTVTVTNVGGKPTIIHPQNARELFDTTNLTGTVDEDSLDGTGEHCSKTGALEIGKSCKYTMSFTTTSIEQAAHTAIVEVQNDAGQIIGEQLEHWTVPNTKFADITMSPDPLDIHANALDAAKTKKVKVVNTASGTSTTAAATMSGIYLNKIDSLGALSIEDEAQCKTLKPSETCEVSVKLDPTKGDENTSLEETSNLVVEGNFPTALDLISYGIRPKKWGLSLDVDYSSNLTGSGAESDHLLVSGGATGNKTVTMKITNTGTEDQDLKGIKTLGAIDPAIWDIDLDKSSCYAGNINISLNKVLAPNASCDLVFNNIYGQRHGYANGDATLASTLPFPKLIVQQQDKSYTMATPVQETPETDLNGEVRVDNQQAIINNTITVEGDGIKLTHTVTNLDDQQKLNYQGAITVKTKVPAMVFDLASFKVEGGHCSYETDSVTSMLELSCGFEGDAATASYSIKAKNDFLSADYLLPVRFDFDTVGNGQIVGMSSWAESANIPKN